MCMMLKITMRRLFLSHGCSKWLLENSALLQWTRQQAKQRSFPLPTKAWLGWALPIVPKGVGRRLLPAFIGFWIQQAVVCVNGMTEVISSILLPCQEKEQRKMRASRMENGSRITTMCKLKAQFDGHLQFLTVPCKDEDGDGEGRGVI